MNADKRPEKFDYWKEIWSEWGSRLEQHQVSPLKACLKFVFGFEEIDKIVIGIDSLFQFEEILSNIDEGNSFPGIDLECNDKKLINPNYW